MAKVDSVGGRLPPAAGRRVGHGRGSAGAGLNPYPKHLSPSLCVAGVAVAKVDSVGRRPLLLGGVSAMVVALLALG